MFVIKRAELLDLTPELFINHAEMPEMIGERPFRPGRLEELEGYIHADEFNNPVWAVAEVKGSGKQYRADGHHTATALVNVWRNDKKFPVGCKVLIVYYEIDSLKEDAANLFLRFDDSEAVRNAVATMNTMAVHYTDLHGVTPKFAVSVVGGIVFHLRDLNKQHRKKKDFDKMIKIHKPKYRGLYLETKTNRLFIVWLNHWKAARYVWLILQKPSVVAEAMANYFAHSEAASSFWDYLLEDDESKHTIKATRAQRELAQTLIDKLNRWRAEKSNAHSPESWRNAVRQAWNEFLAGYKPRR